MELLEAKNLSKKYTGHVIFNGLDLSVRQGTCTIIAGANGCGKSTLLGILSGTISPTGGSVFLDGHKLSRSGFAAHIGYVPQENPLFSSLSVLDNLRFFYCGSSRSLKNDLSGGLAAAFGLTPYQKQTVEKLSGGLKKRLSIVCALAKDPSILILDEPTASLDILGKNDIRNYLMDYRKNGGTILLTSHEDSDLSLADTMYLLKNGQLKLLEHPVFGEELARQIRKDET
jgi:ABC-2 type transport system ATP-binding protein